MDATRYYQPSGRVSPLVLLLWTLALPVAAIAATAYSYLTLYLPIIGTFTVLLTAGLSFLTGTLAVGVLQRGKVRSRAFAAVLSLGLGLFTTWAMWVTWGYALAHRGGSGLPLLALLWPPNLWELMGVVNEQGAWSLKGATPTGGVLWVLWSLEAVILLGLPLVMGLTVVDQPYCEHCESWCTHTKALFLTPAVDQGEAAEHLERRDFAWVQSGGALPRPPPPKFTRWDLFECGCRATNAISAVGIEVALDEKGREKVTETTLVHALLLAPDAVPSFRLIAHRLGLASQQAGDGDAPEAGTA